MKKKALIEMYEKELQDIFDSYKVMKTSSICEVKGRIEAEAIQRFIHNLKNFDNDVLLGIEKIRVFKVGEKFKAKIPFGSKPMKVHICYVLPSTAYRDRTLIVYKVYGKSRQWWHELMCTEKEMESYVEMAKRYE